MQAWAHIDEGYLSDNELTTQRLRKVSKAPRRKPARQTFKYVKFAVWIPSVDKASEIEAKFFKSAKGYEVNMDDVLSGSRATMYALCRRQQLSTYAIMYVKDGDMYDAVLRECICEMKKISIKNKIASLPPPRFEIVEEERNVNIHIFVDGNLRMLNIFGTSTFHSENEIMRRLGDAAGLTHSKIIVTNGLL